MKQIFLFLVFSAMLVTTSNGQVGISADGRQPDPSAMLDVVSSDKGILFPRLTGIERDSLPSPATGLIVYNISTNHFNYFNGSCWKQIESMPRYSVTGTLRPGGGVSVSTIPGVLPDSSAILDISDSTRGVLIPRTLPGLITSPVPGLIIFNSLTGNINYYDGISWKELCSSPTGSPGIPGSQTPLGLSINADGSPTDPSAILDVSASDKGILIPRLTENQRNELFPVAGLTVYNSDANRIDYCDGYSWFMLRVNQISPPTIGLHIASDRQIAWNWNWVSGATGYKWNTVNDYSTALDMGYDFEKIEYALACSTSYTRYVWAYNICGPSDVAVMTQSTLDRPPTPIQSTPSATTSEIRWEWWSPTYDSSKYKWNTVPVYETATDLGMNKYMIESGLTCNTQDSSYVWAYSPCGVSDMLIMHAATMPIPSGDPLPAAYKSSGDWITWKWHPVQYADGYKWNFVDDYSTAIERGGDTTFTETGLMCNTWYDSYVWSYSFCGHSSPVTLTGSTWPAPYQPPYAVGPISSATQIQYTWLKKPGADGYKWGTTDDYATAVDLGEDTTITETNLACGNSYPRYLWAYNACGHSYPYWYVAATTPCWYCGDSLFLVDSRDGKAYSTVMINGRCWMAENLNVGTRINSTIIPSNNGIIQKYCYDDLESNCGIYGGLYNWYELMDYDSTDWHGICPAGWHVPDNSEWCGMEHYLDSNAYCMVNSFGFGTDIGGKIKESGTVHWADPNIGATNSSGFTALPGGIWGFFNPNQYDGIHENAHFLTSTSSLIFTSQVAAHLLYHDAQTAFFYYPYKSCGLSARCIKDYY